MLEGFPCYDFLTEPLYSALSAHRHGKKEWLVTHTNYPL